MKKIFLDTNVVIDFLLQREPFAKDAAIIFELGARKKLKLFVSSLSINNIDYIVSKLESRSKARKLTRKLITLIEVSSVGKITVEKAVESDFKDFEDALQSFCAEEANLKILVTRNVKDFSKSNLSILTPIEFLSTLSDNEK